MPSVPQKRVNPTEGDFPVNESIIPMFALTNIEDRRFVFFAEADDHYRNDGTNQAEIGADNEGFYIKAVPDPLVGTNAFTATGQGRVAGVSYNEVKYPPHAIALSGSGADTESNRGAFRVIDPGITAQQVSVHTAGIIRVEAGSATAFTLGQSVWVGPGGKAVNARPTSPAVNTQPVGWAFRQTKANPKFVQVYLNLGVFFETL